MRQEQTNILIEWNSATYTKVSIKLEFKVWYSMGQAKGTGLGKNEPTNKPIKEPNDQWTRMERMSVSNALFLFYLEEIL